LINRVKVSIPALMTLLESVNGIVIAVAVMSAFVCAPIHARRFTRSSIDAGGLLHLHKNLTLFNLSDLSREGEKSSLGDAPPSRKALPPLMKRKRARKQNLVFSGKQLEMGIFNERMMHTFLGPNLLIQILLMLVSRIPTYFSSSRSVLRTGHFLPGPSIPRSLCPLRLFVPIDSIVLISLH